MRERINGILYNTSKSTMFGTYEVGTRDDDFYKRETLLKTRSARYYLVVSGGSNSEYGMLYGKFNQAIMPLDFFEARHWAIANDTSMMVDKEFYKRVSIYNKKKLLEMLVEDKDTTYNLVIKRTGRWHITEYNMISDENFIAISSDEINKIFSFIKGLGYIDESRCWEGVVDILNTIARNYFLQ